VLLRLRAIAGLLGFLIATCGIFWLVFALFDLRNGGARSERLVVGSKAFTESILLAEMMAQLVEQHTRLEVIRRANLGGTHICFEALRTGDIDVYAEYTGTGLMAILQLEAVNDERRALDIVRREFAERWGLVWLEPLAFNNSYALAMTQQQAAALGIRTISDLRQHNELRVGLTAEFMARSDGWPGLVQTYALAFDEEPRSMEAGLMYGAVERREVDVIGAYATDGRIEKMKLRVLEDDRGFFPPYQAAPLIRRDVLARFPELRATLNVLSGRISDAEMRALNAAVDIHGRDPTEVAAEYLRTLPRPQP
jgi:osmoprotectant transport system substrate-binding protein